VADEAHPPETAAVVAVAADGHRIGLEPLFVAGSTPSFKHKSPRVSCVLFSNRAVPE
jgi:hypothetical protein